MSQVNIPLPWIPRPYPDEVFGSWIGRIMMSNGAGQFRLFLSGFGGTQQGIVRLFEGPKKPGNGIEEILNALGTSYEQAALALTTLPYWASIHSAATAAPNHPGVPAVKCLIDDSARRPAGRSPKLMLPRWCSQCVAQDVQTHGEPFYHRSHQLPAVLVCHRHWEALTTSCVACGAIPVRVDFHDLVSLQLPVQCACGALYADQRRRIRFPSAYKRFVSLSVQLLEQPLLVEGYAKSRSAIYVALTRKRLTLGDAIRKWAKTIGEFREDGPNRLILGLPGNAHALTFHTSKPAMHGADLVAALCALTITHEDVVLDSGTAHVPADKRPRYAWDRMTVSRACRIFLESQAKDTNNCTTSRGFYWYLRIHAPKWLDEHTSFALRALPSVRQDRAVIVKHFADAQASRADKVYPALDRSVRARALIRDAVWYDAARERDLCKRAGLQTEQRRDADRADVEKIERACLALRQENSMPRVISVRRIAARANLPYNRARLVIERNSAVRQSCERLRKLQNFIRLAFSGRAARKSTDALTVDLVRNVARRWKSLSEKETEFVRLLIEAPQKAEDELEKMLCGQRSRFI
jgi:hypothetical protein